MSENLSYDVIDEIESLGWRHDLNNTLPKGYFHTFLDEHVHILTVVKMFDGSEEKWLAFLYSNLEDTKFDLPTPHTYVQDEKGNYVFNDEKDIIPFVKDVNKYLEDKYKGQDMEKLMWDLTERRFGKAHIKRK